MIAITIPDGPVAAFLEAQALARNCAPRQIVLSFLHCISRGDMSEAILDGEDPCTLFPHGLKQPGRELTDFQARVLSGIVARRIGNGVCVASVTDIADLVGRNRGQVRNTIKALCERGYLDCVRVGTQRDPSRYRITERAQRFLSDRRQARAA
jgi:alkylated DNA nucleotide flippase Atl1